MSENDPTKEPDFEKVIRHFVTSPPETHSPLKERRKGGRAEKVVKGERAKPKSGEQSPS